MDCSLMRCNIRYSVLCCRDVTPFMSVPPVLWATVGSSAQTITTTNKTLIFLLFFRNSGTNSLTVDQCLSCVCLDGRSVNEQG